MYAAALLQAAKIKDEDQSPEARQKRAEPANHNITSRSFFKMAQKS